MPKSDDISVEQLIENKFYNSRKFTEEIETIAKENSGMKYIDAIVHFCERIMLTLSLFLSYYLNL